MRRKWSVIPGHYQIYIYFPCHASYFFIPDHLKIQDMCNKEVDIVPHFLALVPDRLNTDEMCNKAVCKDPWLLKYVPDYFVMEEQLKIWHNDSEYCDGHRAIKWYDGYQKRKVQKAKIKYNSSPLLGIDQDGGIGVSPKTKKKGQKNCGHKHGPFCVW